MNSGGEPERDDTGLPPVDIEIPDDARELDRDVQAYYREQRAERRRLRHHRVHGRLTRDGIVLPLLACCLILALIAGTLLTVFTATSDQNLTRLPGYGTGTSGPHTSAPSTSASAGSSAGSGGSAAALTPHVVPTGRPLPAGTLRLAASGQPVPLQRLGETLLVLVPAGCGCTAAISWLAGIGASQGALIYLVGTQRTIGEVNRLHSRLPASIQTEMPVALDRQGLLAHKYPVKGLTAVMVAWDPEAGQSASFAQHLRANDSAAPLLHALSG